jgi:hypothetical protein
MGKLMNTELYKEEGLKKTTKNLSCYHARYYRGFCIEGLKKTTKKPIRLPFQSRDSNGTPSE